MLHNYSLKLKFVSCFVKIPVLKNPSQHIFLIYDIGCYWL